jgi:homoaconitase/3-isopropylmalate dehydratase large subunit
MTITEKVMALNSGRDSVLPGELVWVNVNSVMTMDYLGKQCFKALRASVRTKNYLIKIR